MALCASEEFLYEDFVKAAHLYSPRALKLKDRGQRISVFGAIGGAEPDPANPEFWLAELGGCLLRVRKPLASMLASGRARTRTVVATGMLVREHFQWFLETAMLETLETCVDRARHASCVEVDAARLEPRRQKELLAVLKAWPGETPVRLTVLPPDCPRVLAKIGSRRVTLCPGLEWELRRFFPGSGWRAHVEPVGEAEPGRALATIL
jgi:hypothetical protein